SPPGSRPPRSPPGRLPCRPPAPPRSAMPPATSGSCPPPPPCAPWQAWRPRPPFAPCRPRPHATVSRRFSPRQVRRQYGCQKLRVHVPLRESARIEHARNRRHDLSGLLSRPRLRSQELEQAVQHPGESTPHLEWLLRERECQATHRPSVYRL